MVVALYADRVMPEELAPVAYLQAGSFCIADRTASNLVQAQVQHTSACGNDAVTLLALSITFK